jgi:hypothetical protein
MILLSDLIGQDAIALGTARRTGSVTGVVIEGSAIRAVHTSDATIPASAVRSFEGDVLTYDDTSAVITHGDRHGLDPRKMRVLDMHGDELGAIADLEISADGSIERIVLGDGDSVAGARLRTIGSYAAILDVDLPPPSGPRLG